jgi:hypothetical protein
VRLAELAKLDLDTGVWESYASTTDRTDGVVLYDRAGHARIKRSGPASQQTYFYQAAEASFYEQWDAFDDALPATKPLRFRITPDTALQERSFPIGFGPEQTVFYYASNVGSDTYGLFAFDIVTQRTSARTAIASRWPVPACGSPACASSPSRADGGPSRCGPRKSSPATARTASTRSRVASTTSSTAAATRWSTS